MTTDKTSPLPIYKQTKTTNHKQICASCGRAIVKGQDYFKVLQGNHFNHPAFKNIHMACLSREISLLLTNNN